MLWWEREVVDDHGKVRNAQYFQITVNRGACATTNANRFSKSYDSNQKIITEQLTFFPARVCALFKDENAPEWFMVMTTRNKNKKNENHLF